MTKFGTTLCKVSNLFWIMRIENTICRWSCKNQNRIFETTIFRIYNIDIKAILFINSRCDEIFEKNNVSYCLERVATALVVYEKILSGVSQKKQCGHLL